MFSTVKTRRRNVSLALVLVFGLTAANAAAAQGDGKKKKKVPQGTPVLWRAPADIAARDLRTGPGGAASRPTLRGVRFIEEDKSGTSKKYRVKDGAGRDWVVKVGSEAQSETAAVRLLWAVGYPTEIIHLAPRVYLRGKGNFTNARFEARPKNVDRAGEWKWEDNPFVGTRELQGLKVMMVLLNNWDTKDANNVILHREGSGELDYAISDLGATLGKTGGGLGLWRITRSRNDPEGFAEDKFIDKVRSDGTIDFNFAGKQRGMFNDITVEQARWIGSLLARLSDRQIGDAFRAANYKPSEVRMLTNAVRYRIDQLIRLRR
ncbi:MAG: hypothetical protein LC800_16530 [Acidobacteria bacterium]|nr:hypothetical protein [Acidobacteriota bacterium]